MSARIFYQEDCDLSYLEGKTIAIIGYGSQGHAHALNLKESGCKVIIGLYEGSRSWNRAVEQGFEVFTAAEAAKKEADAKAYAGEKEAEANQKIANSLTDDLIEYKTIEQWNGELPTYVGGESSIPVLNFGQNTSGND